VNIPSAIVRIMSTTEWQNDKPFQVLYKALERLLGWI
jgi:hypothetical protein